jgi:hypothetical protein
MEIIGKIINVKILNQGRGGLNDSNNSVKHII